MATALYGPNGFYRSAGAPARHFRTAAHTGHVWATAIDALVRRVHDDLGRPDEFTVVEVGAGHGELLAGLAGLGSSRWNLVGVDVAPRPDHLPSTIEWRPGLPGSFVGVLLAVEWLDVVPVDVVELTDDGPRLVEVHTDGAERIGAAVSDRDRAWLDRWWPLAEVGDRAEVGRPRDEAWGDAVSRLQTGVAVAVDYAAVPARDVAGTLTGYKDGRQVMPVPDGSMDITAHVLFESLTATAVLTQRDALRELGVSGARPAYDGETADYLSALSHAGDEAELLDPGGLGGFGWLVQSKGTRNPLATTGTVRGSRP
jgi:SAM-dependent MidA family methyltransferase